MMRFKTKIDPLPTLQCFGPTRIARYAYTLPVCWKTFTKCVDQEKIYILQSKVDRIKQVYQLKYSLADQFKNWVLYYSILSLHGILFGTDGKKLQLAQIL